MNSERPNGLGFLATNSEDNAYCTNPAF